MTRFQYFKNKLKKDKILFIHFLISTWYFASLWYKQFIFLPEGVAAGSTSSWADGAVHLTYASSFAYKNTFPQNLPIFAGHPYTYSFVSDMLTGLLAKLGLNIFTSHSLLGFLLSLLFIYTLYKFYKLFLKNTLAAIISSWIFIFSGGLGFIWFIQDIYKQNIFEVFKNPIREYTHIGEIGLEWINTVSSELLPQRSFLLGLPLGLLILTYIWNLYTNPTKIKKTHTLLVGFIMGLLPVIHPHTLITMFTTFVCITPFIFLQNPKHHKTIFSNLTISTITAIILGIPLITTFVLPATGEGFFRFYPGWLAKSKDLNWLWFWFLNWGAFPFTSALGIYLLDRRQKIFTFPFIILFIISNLFLFQPYDWDNSKILTWVYLVLAAPSGLLITTIFDHKLINKTTSLLLLLTLTLSGFLDATRLLNPNLAAIPMYTNEELDLATWVKKNTSEDAVFATSDRHSHPVPNLTGRQILMGYRGWLWTYGIDYDLRQKQISTIYKNPSEASEIIKSLDLDYVVIGPSEIGDWQPDIEYFNKNTLTVFKSKNYTIYKIETNN